MDRTGADLVKATKPWAEEDTTRTWTLFLTTLAVHAALFGLVLGTEGWWIGLPAAVILGLVGVREFIFFHDWAHGAIFRKSTLGSVAMHGVGIYTLAAPSVWRETHDYHHQNNAKLIGSSIGSYPTVSLGMYRGMTPEQRRQLKLVRHPLTIAAGLFTTFFLGMCFAAFRRDPKQHAFIPVAVTLWWAAFAGLWWGFGLDDALYAWLLPAAIHSAVGSYLFYAQHNFPDAELKNRRQWDYTHAALRSSSYFEMPALMHWFTGNIGYHHVHHLNHRIPFYNLPDAMAGVPEFQNPGRTSWRIADIRAALDCSVWDPDSNRFISFSEADARLGADEGASTRAAAAK